ncbi:pyridoxal phosphate-dependent aminotransferase [Deinococcus roseus]|uniref:Histidinol-phosphate aminotransferase n=1 Tax=Deinococcus roseus TaxID=392414 RepID=A0ABQ2DIL7_9DEIO|nr:histidinol-phosphate transaminase [Deinococcus roseus]GGJ57882.1 histidinol-phosphate aminotransferase [Deinococcus roseus]
MTQSIRKSVKDTPAYPFQAIDVPIKLDQNENPYDFPADLKQEVARRILDTPFNRYPDLHADRLKVAIGKFENWNPAGVVVTPGSNVLLHQLTSLAGLRQKVLTVKPTFAVYTLEASILESDLTLVPLNPDFSLPVEALKAELQKGGPGLFYITEPHAPTGKLDSVAEVEALLEVAKEHGWLSVIDEAYYQFGGNDFRYAVEKYGNVIVIRTFSKAWGMAGLRLGYALTSVELATELQKVISAFNVNALTTVAVEVALENPGYVQKIADEQRSERDRMVSALQAHPTWTVYPSSTNFFLVRTPNAPEAYQELIKHGVLVRRQDSGFMLEGVLRVSVGTPQENDRFLEAALQVQTA